MGADISALGELRPIEQLDLGNYKDSQEAAPTPPKGEYTVQAPPEFPSTAFGRTKAGALSIEVSPTIAGGEFDGYKTRFVKISAKPFKRGGLTVSQVGDYLRAFGVRQRFSNEQELADAVVETANQQYRVNVDWRAYNKETGYAVEGMENFPTDGNGGHLPWVEDPTTKTRLRAQLIVTRFVPAVEN